ncbi:linoleate diol synthase [Colletotrichum cereale]|nr:linoleate diol synthase [Colletotrichum cereale]
MATRPTAETPSKEDQLMDLTLQLRNKDNAKKYAQFHGDSLISNKITEKVGLLGDLTKALAPSNWGALGDIAGSLLSGKGLDKAGVARVAGSLSNYSTNREKLINSQVREKYDKMLHPPLTYLGDAFQYRTADGSFNSALNPHLGQAGGPYAKTVPSKTAPLGALPDPEVLFDRLMAREEGGRQSQSGLSSMLLYHATIIIHDIFRTNEDDKNISDSSSYLDLSPLYGYTEEMVRKVRDDKYKLGLLKPDTFAEDRLLRQPPGVCIMLVMYNRYHNYAARQLLRINENGRFSVPEMYRGKRLVALIKEHLPDRDDHGIKAKLDSRVNDLCNQYESSWDKVRAARPPDAPDAPEKQDPETPEQTAVREAAEKKRKAALDLITAFESKKLYTNFADVERQLKQKLKEKGQRLERESPALLKSFEKKCKDFKMAWKAAWDKQDDDLFNTARLITQGMYVNISIHDYLRTLMGFHQFDSDFTLDPRKDFDQKKTTRGIGNQVTVEFNLLYRFHCAISLRDEEYTKEYMEAALGIKEPDHLSLPEFLKVMSYEKQKGVKPEEPWQVTFGVPDVAPTKTSPGSEYGPSTDRSRNNSDSGISMDSASVDVDDPKAKNAPAIATPSVANPKHFARNEITGLFDDQQMLNELTAAMDEPLSNFGPRNVPKCLKPVEIMGIMQARKWEVGTLNDFRSFFELPVHTTFESVSRNPDIQNTLRDLYESPDKIELYPGIFCESDAKMGLDPGPEESTSALWAAIFSDAITLVRSDRFYTVDWNTQSLTAWGMKEVTPDTEVCKSSVFHRLIQRAFPEWLPRDSLRWFSPFYTAKQNAIYAEQQGYASQFKETANFELKPRYARAKAAASIVACPPKRPHKPCYLDNFHDIYTVLKEKSNHFTNPVFSYKANLPHELRSVLDRETMRPIDFDPEILEEYVKDAEMGLKTYLSKLMTDIIKRESVSITNAEFQIDATRDFAIPVVTRYMAAFLGFSHKLREVPATSTGSDKRTQIAHHGTYTENEIYQHITNCQVFLAYNTDETKWMARREAFQKSVKFLIDLAERGTIWEAKQWLGLSNMLFGREESNAMHRMGVFVARQVLKHERNPTRAAAILLLISLDFAYNAVVSFTATLDGFMNDLYQVANSDNIEDEPQWLALQRAALADDDDTVEEMVQNMARNKVNLPIVRKVLKEGQFDFVGVGKGKSTTLKEGQYVVLDLAPATAIAAEVQDKHRLEFLTLQLSIADKYAVFSPRRFTPLSQAQMIKFISLTRNTRRGPAAQGELKHVHLEPTAEGYATYMAPERVKWIKKQCDELMDRKKASRIFNDNIFLPGFDAFLTPAWDEYVPFPMTWKIRFDGFGKSDYMDKNHVKYGQVRTVGKALPDFCPPWYQPKGPSSEGGTFAMVKCVCADGGCGCSGGKAGRKERAPKPMAMSSGCRAPH